MTARIFFTLLLAVALTAVSAYATAVCQGVDVTANYVQNVVPNLDPGYYYAFWALVGINGLFLLLNLLNISGRRENPKINLFGIFLNTCLLLVFSSLLCFHNHGAESAAWIQKHWHGVEHWGIAAFVAALILNAFTFMLCLIGRTPVEVNVKCYCKDGECGTKELVEV